MGVRTTKIKDWTGERYDIPNGNISQVTNYSIHNGTPVVDVNKPYENDVYNAQEIIESINKKVFNETDMFVTEPEIIDVQSLDVSYYIIRIISETSPGNQLSAELYLRGEIQSL